jgi:phage I-like protein
MKVLNRSSPFGFLTQLDAALDADTLPRRIPLNPFGTFKGNGKTYVFDDKSLAAAKAALAESGVRLVVDWHHQTLDVESGKRETAKAAAWISDLEVDNGYVYGVVEEWTELAADMVRKKEYRYTSPVFWHDKDGWVGYYHSAALTNRPGTYGQRPIGLEAFDRRTSLERSFSEVHRMLAQALAQAFGGREVWPVEVFDTHLIFEREGGELFRADYRIEGDEVILGNEFTPVQRAFVPKPAKEASMNPILKAMLEALGLPEDADQQTALEALKTLQGQAALAAQAKEHLGLASLEDTPENRGRLMALSQLADQSAQIAALTAEIQELREGTTHDRAERLVRAALEAGKITAAQQAFWLDRATEDYDAAKAYLESAPAVVPVDVDLSRKPKDGQAALEADQEKINHLLGLDKDTFLKHNKEVN